MEERTEIEKQAVSYQMREMLDHCSAYARHQMDLLDQMAVLDFFFASLLSSFSDELCLGISSAAAKVMHNLPVLFKFFRAKLC